MPDIETLLNIETEVTQILSDLGVISKLNEMDDFMNQNDVKVSITNENAVPTGLVTYTCTVKDKNNNALENRVVEWYEGTTLVGMDATNSSGVSTFSKHVTTASIYDVHAIVKGTHAGDDIRMFVKDKNNRASYNLWSGGDYSHNTNGASLHVVTGEVINDMSTNGDCCIHIVKPAESSNAYLYVTPTLTEADIGKTLTFTADIYTPNNSVAIKVKSESFSGTTVPANTEFETVSASKTITTTTDVHGYINLDQDNDDCYIDNVKITIQ